MPAPGVTIIERTATPRSTPPTDTGVPFVAAPALQGPTTPQQVYSTDDVVSLYGARDPVGMLYDWCDIFFREGGYAAWVVRVPGSGASAANATVLDAGNATCLTVSANGPGTWGQTLSFAILAGFGLGTYTIRVLLGSVILEQSPDLTTRDDAIYWSQVSARYITLAPGASANPPKVQGPTALTGGAQGSAVADSDFTTALATFDRKLGPGQVACPGRTSATVQNAMLAHAAATNRHAVIDLPDVASAATLASATAALAGANARYGSAYAPWARTTGIAPGTYRPIPWSAVQCGMFARNDGINGAGQPVAGVNAISQTTVTLSQSFSDADLATLNDAGVNVARLVAGTVRTMGIRTLANPTSQQPYLQTNQVRLLMAITAELRAEADDFVFAKLDGLGHTLGRFQSSLMSVCQRWFVLDELYGRTPEDAYNVDVGPAVNTAASFATGNLRARVSLRVVPGAEFVTIEIVKTPITEAIAA